ncbi:uncharacterized protein G6M90_00g081390 [Metarhizium brunneum]|uniref:Zn(2)-C6 fungal-type domain-containing protein n=1 Tax=Metarhizium brunneum TaxID=500148 RepID=A0A7D5V1Z7_9HYPO
MSSPDRTAPRRPNGRLQACDPCRRRKVACDHTQPVCNRCRARNQAGNCVYLVGDSKPTPSNKTSSSFDFNTAPSRTVSEDTQPPARKSRHLHAASSSRDMSSASASGSGFLGATSHSAVYDETTQTLSMLQGFQACLPVPGEARQRQRPADVSSDVLLSPTREMCLVVLRSIPSPPPGPIALRMSPHLYDGWAPVAAQRILESLYGRFGKYLGANRVDSQLEEIATTLSNNTLRPFSDNVRDPEEWISQLSGPNLRWESLGLLFTFKELGEDRSWATQRGVSGESLSKHWPEVSRVCLGLSIDLARRFSDGNSILLLLCTRRAIAESVIMGDASLSCWRAMSESTSLLTFLGHHAESPSPTYEPCLSSETRRRVAAHVFILDKVIVLFTGRPPQISRRYISTPLPLDLDDEELLGGEAAIASSVRALDENGWNTKGGLYAATSLRCRLQIALLRDELVEIAVGNWKETSVEALLQLKRRETDTVAGFPDSVAYRDGEFDDPLADMERVYARLIIKLEHLQNLFVVERLLSRRGHHDEGELLATSFELVSRTLLFWTNKDRFGMARADFAWLVMAYATPGGGILCMELLKPTFGGRHGRNPKMTRSGIIQQLSLLVGFLDWIGPGGPNGELCANCSSVIQLVLDHTLNAPEDERWPPVSLDAMQLDFNFELFDTFDWLRPDTLL